MKNLNQWFRDNGLSIAFFSLFLISLVAQSISGLHSFNDQLRTFGRQPVDFAQYVVTGTFLDGVFSNWQAAFLQLACLVVFSEFLYQKGASHSRRFRLRPQRLNQKALRKPWIYRHSLSIVLGLFFVFSFVLHMVFGSQAYNETLILAGKNPISLGGYLNSGTFWFSTWQTWEAEFVAMGTFLVMSIFLRQQRSPESKPVESSNEETGVVNS